jgi:hypothetical protein
MVFRRAVLRLEKGGRDVIVVTHGGSGT